MSTSFEQRFKLWESRMRKDNAIKAFDIIQEAVKSGKILTMTFSANKQYGEADDEIIVDYSVDLSNGKNLADLGLESFEEAITDIAKELKEQK